VNINATNSIKLNGTALATQSYVTGLGYITATPGADVNMNTYSVNLTDGRLALDGNGIIYFYSNTNLATTYTGARIVLWPGSGFSTSTDWYGLGMNSGQMVYNVPSGQTHSFQVNGTAVVAINSGGISVAGSVLASQYWVQTQGYITDTPTGIALTGTRAINFGPYGAYICNYNDFFSIYGGSNAGNLITVQFFQNVVSFGGFVGRQGLGNYNTANVMNR
jgi:hypothetical protein